MSRSVPSRRLDSPSATAAIMLVLGAVFVLARLGALDWDASRFVAAGARFADPASVPAGLAVEPGTGFDGQFFYRLALDPLTAARVANGIELDIPALRQQRILYPALAWALSGGGRTAAVPWVLIALNLAGLAVVGGLAGSLARAVGRPAWWGLALSLYPGFAVTLGLDLAEIVASALLLAGLLLIRRARPVPGGLYLAGAVLARETALVVVVALVIVWGRAVLRRRSAPVPAWSFVPALFAYGTVQTWLWARWGEPPLASGGAVNVGVPFRKLASEVAAWPDQGGAFAAYHWLLLIAIAGFVTAVFLSLRPSDAAAYERAGFLIAAALVPFLAGTIWLHYWAFLRALTELYLLGALVLLSRPRGRLDRLLVGAGALWLSVALNMTVAASRLIPPA